MEQILPKSKKSTIDITNKIIKICSRIRYILIAHKPPKIQKYNLRMLLALLVLLNASILIIWEEDWLFLPYIFVNFVAPFVGVIWLASGISYGVGKTFIVLNVLSIFDNLIALFQSIIYWNDTSWLYKIMRLITVIIQIVAS